MRVEFRVLGEVCARVDGRAVDVGPARQRARSWTVPRTTAADGYRELCAPWTDLFFADSKRRTHPWGPAGAGGTPRGRTK
jgi:hypothetical protein